MEDGHDTHSTNYINGKIVITAVMSVLLGIAFVLALINFGMNVQRKFDGATQENTDVSVIKVDYRKDYFSFDAKCSNSDAVNDDCEKASLIERIGGKKGDAYYVIDSQTKLDTLLPLVNGIDGYQVEKDFFLSGSIILVAAEGNSLQNFKVTSVTRDEDYNLSIDAKVDEEPTPNTTITGGLGALIKISNIQPKKVTFNLDKKAPAKN